MKNFKCSVFHCNSPLECGFVGSISIYGSSYLAAQEIWQELLSKGIFDQVIIKCSLKAWHRDGNPRKIEKFSMVSPQIYYASHPDHRAMTMSGMNWQGNGSSVDIKFFDEWVMDLCLLELSKMHSIKETLISRS